MKQSWLVAASLLALTLGTAAQAMQTVPYGSPSSGTALGPAPSSNPYGILRDPNAGDVVPNPFANGNGVYPNNNPMGFYMIGPGSSRQNAPGQGFLNIDPFDPNSVMNDFDRYRYANPYSYDPRYNPYGQSASPYAPGGGGNVTPGKGIPYGR